MNAAPRLFRRVAILGIGLIGSSLARVIRREDLAAEIVAGDADPAACAAARELGIVDEALTDVAAAAERADLILLCVPVRACGPVMAQIAPVLAAGALVTDVGSVKQAVIEAVAPTLPPGVHFVPGHPVAGTERSGPAAGFDTLFANRWTILTPTPGTDPDAVDRVAELWRAAGAHVELMDAVHHDQVLAITSHVPHLIAYTIVGTATDLEDHLKAEVVKFAAGGFRDFTRIAASDPVMWRDIFLTNREAVLDSIGRLWEDLAVLQRAIRTGDGDTLEAMFTRTRDLRRGVVDAGQHIPPRGPDDQRR